MRLRFSQREINRSRLFSHDHEIGRHFFSPSGCKQITWWSPQWTPTESILRSKLSTPHSLLWPLDARMPHPNSWQLWRHSLIYVVWVGWDNLFSLVMKKRWSSCDVPGPREITAASIPQTVLGEMQPPKKTNYFSSCTKKRGAIQTETWDLFETNSNLSREF